MNEDTTEQTSLPKSPLVTTTALDRRIFTYIRYFEKVGLILIALITFLAIGQEVMSMLHVGKILLQDILILFLYLEVLAMVGIYFESGKLPIRYPIYIAIVAIARYITIGMKDLDGWNIIELALAIFVLACAVLVIRYGHIRWAYYDEKE